MILTIFLLQHRPWWVGWYTKDENYASLLILQSNKTLCIYTLCNQLLYRLFMLEGPFSVRSNSKKVLSTHCQMAILLLQGLLSQLEVEIGKISRDYCARLFEQLLQALVSKFILQYFYKQISRHLFLKIVMRLYECQVSPTFSQLKTVYRRPTQYTSFLYFLFLKILIKMWMQIHNYSYPLTILSQDQVTIFLKAQEHPLLKIMHIRACKKLQIVFHI